MLKRDLDLIEKKLEVACRQARREGKRIIRRGFSALAVGRRRPGCCPIEAFWPGAGAGRILLDEVAGALGATTRGLWMIVAGVDGGGRESVLDEDRQFYDLGVRLRRKLHIR